MADHIIELTATGWTLMHPLTCRPVLFDCPVSRYAEQSLTEAPAAGVGRFLCGIDEYNNFTIGERAEHLATPTEMVLVEVAAERARQDAKWGEQNHPDGTGLDHAHRAAMAARQVCQFAAEQGNLTWRHILGEEVAEALAEADPAKLRTELLQVAAVAVAWIECIDRPGAAAQAGESGG